MRAEIARSSRISSGSTSRVPGGMAFMTPAYAGTRSEATRSMCAPSPRRRSSIRS